jgi:hypothetical protein
VILITTGSSQIAGTIPTEIGQLTELTRLHLGKYEGCLRCFHAPIAAGFSHENCFFSIWTIHQRHHCHSSPYCPLFVILITTGSSQIAGTIPTEIGQLTVLTILWLGKYDGCLRRFHALFSIYKLTYVVLFSPLIALN